MKLLPTKNKVVLISRFNKNTSIDFSYIKNEINMKYPETYVVILNHKNKHEFLSISNILIEMYHLATSKGAIVDSYIIPVSVLKHKEDLIIIQIWHALGAIKKFGHDAIDTLEGSPSKIARGLNMHENYNYVICGGEGTIPHFSKAFNVSEDIIKPYGLPRIDYLVDENNLKKNKEKIYKHYPQLKDKKAIIYAPTFRKNKSFKINELLKELDLKKYNIIIKLHPMDKTEIDNVNNNVIIDTKFSTIKLLSIADYVITDYSAVAFEAAVLEVPLYFYLYDIDEYIENRGLNIDLLKEMNGIAFKTAKGLTSALEKQYKKDRMLKFKDKYVIIDKIKSTEKIVGLLKLSE